MKLWHVMSGVTACLVLAGIVYGGDEPPEQPRSVMFGKLQVPEGFRPVPGTQAEPYSKTGWAKEIVHVKTGIELVFIPAGEFVMGSPAGEAKRDDDEGPRQRVRLTRPFYMGKYEVTQNQWQKMMGENPSRFKGSERLPVENFPRDVCEYFLDRAGGGLRLPTEAQWEYACRAGTTTPFNTGATLSTDEANFDGNFTYGSGHKGVYRRRTVDVGSFKPNAWGLYDMHGNVWEWCQDWYAEKRSIRGDDVVVDPTGPPEGRSRKGRYSVVRGGSWYDLPGVCRSASRGWGDTSYGRAYYDIVGLRVILPLP